VLDAAGSRRVVLFGASEGGPARIKFSADRPDHVAGLILFASLAKGSATPDYPHALKASQYDTAAARRSLGWSCRHRDVRTKPVWRSSGESLLGGLAAGRSEPGSHQGRARALRDRDVRHLLGRISAPTQVLHRPGDRTVRIGAGRHLASHIAQARFVELDGADHWAFAGDSQPVLANIKQFVDSLGA
jgi:pimeloyl-ACP methyl ester carboxylesterase